MTDQSKETELKPCRSCGELITDDQPAKVIGNWNIECVNDFCLERPSVTSKTRAMAVHFWNQMNTSTPDLSQLLKDRSELVILLQDTRSAFDTNPRPERSLASVEEFKSDVRKRYRTLLARLSPQEQESVRSCGRCGKRLYDSHIHTCSPQKQEEQS